MLADKSLRVQSSELDEQFTELELASGNGDAQLLIKSGQSVVFFNEMQFVISRS